MRLRGSFMALALAVAAPAFTGCAVTEEIQRVPKVDHVADPSPWPAVTSAPDAQAERAEQAAIAPTRGAIYQAARYRPLFEDHRARLPGDTLTVTIVEKVSAVQKSTSTVDKTGALEAGVTALPGISSKAFARGTASASNSNTFSGKGTTENSNDFSGNITATVVKVLPNGHLVISGEKQIGVNANVDVMRFSGTVDPRFLRPGNRVASTQVADVRIQSRNRGAQGEEMSIGWLARFFLSVLPF